MADELNRVSPGDQLLASQYNALVDAVGGPSNPNSSAPFVKTPSGSISTSGSPYIPKEQNDLHPPLFSLRYSYGDLPDKFRESDDDFCGLWCFLGDSINTRWCKHEQTFENARRFIIDPTTPPAAVQLIEYTNMTFPTGWVPLGLGGDPLWMIVFQIRSGQNQSPAIGSTVSIIGNVSLFPDFPLSDRTSSPVNWIGEDTLQQIMLNLMDVIPGITRDDYLQILDCFCIYLPQSDIESYDPENPPMFLQEPMAQNIGGQFCESYPDASVNGVMNCKYVDTYLSSLGFVPSEYYNVNSGSGTWAWELFNFNLLSSTSDSLSSIIDSNDLSSYDVLIKHKATHPGAEDNEVFEDQCSAVLEYMPLSSLIGSSSHTGDANSNSHNLSSIYLSSDGQYELFNFHLSGTTGLTKYDWQYGLSNDIEVVVRDNTTPGQSKVNYIPKSWLSAVGGDKNVLDVRRSIEYVNNPDPYYQLYGFGDESFIHLDPTRHGSFDFVVRYHNAVSQREEIQYGRLDLSSIAQISGDSNIMHPDQNSIVTVADGFGNVWHQLYGLGDTGVISATMTYDGSDHYIMNEGNSWTNPNKQFLYYDYTDKRLKYGDICLYMPKVKASDLDDDVLPEISDVIIPEVSVMISAELSALDDRYWIKGEDETENYGSAIGDSGANIAIDLDNKYLYNNSRVAISLNDYQLNGDTYEYWKTPNLSATRNITAGNQVTAPTIWATGSGGVLKIGSTTLNETQLRQLLSLLNAPQRLQNL